jgi:ABC-type amino acid transport substrate-binding protein
MSSYLKLILILTFSLNSQAKELRAAIFNIAPWGQETKSGEVIGIQKEIISIISKDMNIPISIELLPYKRMVKSLKNGDSDFSIFYRTKENETFADPLVRWGELSIIVLPRKEVKIKSYKDLQGTHVGVRLGGKFDERFDNDNSVVKRNCINYADCIDKLRQGRIDAVIGTAATLFYELEVQGLKTSFFGDPFFISKKEDWLHFSKSSKNKKYKKALVKSVEKNIKNGNFNKVFSKYLPKKWQHK